MQNINEKTALGLHQNIGALVCYVGNLICSFGLIYSIIVVVQDKTNKLVRFHAFQSILCSVFGIIVGTVAVIVAAVAGIIDGFIGLPLFSLIVGLLLLVIALILFVMIVKASMNAYRGRIYKILLIGNLAEKWSATA